MSGIWIIIRWLMTTKKKLHQALLYIRQALGKMRLRMKNDWQVFRFEYTKKNGKKTGRCVSAMGWLFYRSKVLIRKHILLHVERIARKLHKKEENGQRFPLGALPKVVLYRCWGGSHIQKRMTGI